VAIQHQAAAALVSRADFDLLEPETVNALVRAVETVTSCGAVFSVEPSPEGLFRHAVASAIDAIERRGTLLRRFLVPGPYHGDGPVPASSHLSDQDCVKAVTLIYSHVVNCFKGQLAELLALDATSSLIRHLKDDGYIPESADWFVGDAVMPGRARGMSKGADAHVIHETSAGVELLAVVEVKSFVVSAQRLERQLATHVARAGSGLWLRRFGHAERFVGLNCRSQPPIRISVSAGRWRLPRRFEYEEANGNRILRIPQLPTIPDDEILQVDSNHWHITLGWSSEALSSEAYSLTYWYMEQLGAELFADSASSPWPHMSPVEAGRNAATQSLYWAIRRCRDNTSRQRAIALYNAYGFGYALGTSFRDAKGQRQMLWPRDLDEILADGVTKEGYRLRP